MPPPVGFDFETAKEILRLVKKNKNGSLNRPIEAEVQNLNNPQLVIAFIASPEITVYNDTYKIFRIPNAKMVPFNTGIEITNGRLAFGRTNDDGEIYTVIDLDRESKEMSMDSIYDKIGDS